MEVEPKIDIVTIPLSILQVFQTWCCQGGTLGWSSTVELHFLQHRVSELMHSYTSDPSPSPLHLWSFTVPTSPRSGQGSSLSNTMLLTLSPTFNFFVNVGMVWCWWVTHGMSISMRFSPLMYDFDIRRCDMVEGDGERLCEWKCFLRWYSCTTGFIQIVLVTVSESRRRVFLIKVIVMW